MTTIGPSFHIFGEITSNEDLTIHGRVNGLIRLRQGSLLVAPKAHVDAEIRGVRIIIHGNVAGNVSASERIELTPTSNVAGGLSANRVVVADGARFNGRIDMDQRTIAVKIGKYRAIHAAVAR
jgi:cytoskeletal protein CcmA (bactofilin family)